VLREAGREEPVFLRILRARPWEEPMVEIGIYGENGGAEVGRLILASTNALLLYHAASQDAALARGRMIPNQLASIGRGDEDPGARLAILLETGMPDPAAGRRSLPELEAGQGAALVALAEVLGAWGPLRRNRFPLAGDGRPVLPFFSPAAPDLDWDQLRSNPLEVFLPSAIADHIAGEPGYRERIYEDLFELSARLPELQGSIASLARSRALRPFGPDVSELESLRARRLKARGDPRSQLRGPSGLSGLGLGRATGDADLAHGGHPRALPPQRGPRLAERVPRHARPPTRSAEHRRLRIHAPGRHLYR
jgi:hypothetical protein